MWVTLLGVVLVFQLVLLVQLSLMVFEMRLGWEWGKRPFPTQLAQEYHCQADFLNYLGNRSIQLSKRKIKKLAPLSLETPS